MSKIPFLFSRFFGILVPDLLELYTFFKHLFGVIGKVNFDLHILLVIRALNPVHPFDDSRQFTIITDDAITFA